MRPVIKLEELSLQAQTHGESFLARTASVAAPLGATHLGARYVEIPPGKKAWPYHSHHANDELFVILEGRGRLRHGGHDYAIASGDVVVCPAGGAESAHQLTAEGDQPLKYLAVSSMREPDVLEYPDSGKMAVFAGSAPGGDKAARRVDLVVRPADRVDYWEGED
ncbi:cupin domain-containing protein [Amorphus sp. 3PC139-8]|uniref:cupin domain-containing protein n=1 Tax=Amorphus sp. 3PC139-8 TaxID=2735676 RepID=UPI00345D3D3B